MSVVCLLLSGTRSHGRNAVQFCLFRQTASSLIELASELNEHIIEDAMQY